MRRIGFLAAAAAVVLVTGLQIAPAHADADDWGWRRPEWREHKAREAVWRRHEWREHHRYSYWYPGYFTYGYYR